MEIKYRHRGDIKYFRAMTGRYRKQLPWGNWALPTWFSVSVVLIPMFFATLTLFSETRSWAKEANFAFLVFGSTMLFVLWRTNRRGLQSYMAKPNFGASSK